MKGQRQEVVISWESRQSNKVGITRKGLSGKTMKEIQPLLEMLPKTKKKKKREKYPDFSFVPALQSPARISY